MPASPLRMPSRAVVEDRVAQAREQFLLARLAALVDVLQHRGIGHVLGLVGGLHQLHLLLVRELAGLALEAQLLEHHLHVGAGGREAVHLPRSAGPLRFLARARCPLLDRCQRERFERQHGGRLLLHLGEPGRRGQHAWQLAGLGDLARARQQRELAIDRALGPGIEPGPQAVDQAAMRAQQPREAGREQARVLAAGGHQPRQRDDGGLRPAVHRERQPRQRRLRTARDLGERRHRLGRADGRERLARVFLGRAALEQRHGLGAAFEQRGGRHLVVAPEAARIAEPHLRGLRGGGGIGDGQQQPVQRLAAVLLAGQPQRERVREFGAFGQQQRRQRLAARMQRGQRGLDQVGALLPLGLGCGRELLAQHFLGIAHGAVPAVVDGLAGVAGEAAAPLLGLLVVAAFHLQAQRRQVDLDRAGQPVLRDQVLDQEHHRAGLVAARVVVHEGQQQRIGLGIGRRGRGLVAREHALGRGPQRGIGRGQVQRQLEVVAGPLPGLRQIEHRTGRGKAPRGIGELARLRRDAQRRALREPGRRAFGHGLGGRLAVRGHRALRELARRILRLLAHLGGGAPARQQAMGLELLEGHRGALLAHAVLALERGGRELVAGLDAAVLDRDAHGLDDALALAVEAFARDGRRCRRGGCGRGCGDLRRCLHGCGRRCLGGRGRRRFRLRLGLGLADARIGAHADFLVALAGLLAHQLGQRGGSLRGIGEGLGLALARGADAAPADVEIVLRLFHFPELAGGSLDQFKTAHGKKILLGFVDERTSRSVAVRKPGGRIGAPCERRVQAAHRRARGFKTQAPDGHPAVACCAPERSGKDNAWP
ncbi:MAG: hypothetical protein GAK39_00369 [Variovorax sp.]|nr:MAG: hypothetical protein GAK39_00369 [Variovorax sp.]